MSQRRFRLRATHLVLFFLSLACVVVLTATASDINRKRSFGIGRQVSQDFTGIKDQGSGSSIAVHAAGQGNPWINLSDGRDIPTVYTGAADLTQILEQNLARPLALGSADFDEDGVPDLIAGYAGPGGGIITLHRGNVDSIYPNAPEAQQRKANGTYTDSPFLSTVPVFEVPEAPDFLGTGDFDADSHWDVVAAARGGNALWLLSGDGQGSFGVARRIDLPGRVTTLVTGEINRADGLADLVVGVVAVEGPMALIFQSPEGAVLGVPEALGLPAEANALALGHLDDDHTMDLAVGAGSELLVVFGRDGTLSLDEIGEAEAPDANIGQHSFPFAIRSAVIGDFTGDHQIGLSLLLDDGAVYLLSGSDETGPEKAGGNRVREWKSELVVRGPWPQGAQLVLARLSSTPVDNLVIADSANHKLHVIFNNADPRYEGSSTQIVSLDVEGEPLAVLPMRLNADAVSDLVILREGQSAPISMTSGPLAVFTVTNTNDSGTGSLRQAILDANGQAGLDMIAFDIPPAGLKTITPLSSLPTITDAVTLDATTQPGFAGNPIIQLNGINMQPGPSGLSLSGGNSLVRGLAIYLFNLHGIQLTTNGGSVIEGNHLGTPASGTSDLGNNRDGVSVSSANNTIGGTAAAARNIISGNEGDGVQIRLSGATGNLVQGNYIGTDISGTDDLGNTLWGVDIREAAANNTIGGTAAGAHNIISGNDQDGILIIGFGGGVTGNLVQGNFIGTDGNGTADLGNSQDGISITLGASSNTIGGTISGARNTIAFNGGDGVFIEPDCVNNPILSNSIHSNSGLGIDLAPDGVNANDACDADAGANNRQNFPVLTSASTTSIQGSLNSSANTTFTIQFFASSSCGEGETFVGSTTVTTNSSCTASFTFPASLTPGQFITATATDPSNNTSEFSACRVVTGSSLQFSSAAFSAGEAAGTTLISVTRSGDSGGAASVQFSTAAGGTATGGASCTAGADYVSTAGTLNWAAGDAANKTFPITICDDNVFEDNETVNLGLSNATGATLGTPNAATLTITDNDAQPTISITDVTQTEGNSGTTNFGFTVSLSNPTTQTVTVNYATANVTATAGADYQAISVTTLTFNPGITSLPVNVLVNGDTLNEENETFFVNLSSPTNATIADNQGVGTITDDDPLPNLTISDVSQVEGNSGTTNFNFTVSLSAASGRTVTVNYATADGTGTAGSDYQGIGLTALTFTAGQTSKTVTVLVNGDTANELDETFFVDLSGAANANLTDDQGQGTIVNDDALPTLSINDVSVTEGNSGTVSAVFTVSLSPASGRTVTVNYATANGTATAGGDYQAAANALTFSPGETSKPVTVLVIGDTLNESNETFFVNLTNALNATMANGQGVGTITNDDPVPTGNLTISGRILDDSGVSISGLLVILGGAESGSTITDSNGNYSFPNLSAGNYTVTPSSGNYSFSPTNYSFNNVTVDRIGHFVGTQTVVSITGRVTDSNEIGLGSVTLGLSKNGTPEGTLSTDNLGNYSFGNLTAGANYVVTPVGSFSPSILFFDDLSVNTTANFTAVPTIPPTSAAISGRAADANNNPLANITVTLSGPITRVTSTDGAGNYSFANLAPGGNYAVTIQNNYFVFSASRADFLNLSGSQTFDFKAAPVAVPSPRPPPSDDFDGPERDPNKWNLGTLSLPPTAFDPQVSVAQINGELVITPLSQVSGRHHNGYVSAHSFDLSGGSVSVELVQAATGGADTIFAIGSDVDNFYRFMVNTAGPEPVPALNGREKNGIKRPRDTVAQLLFQVNVGGQLTALSIPYDPIAHRFMRFRHDAPANAIVFETSPDSIEFTERHRVVLARSVSALTAELSAGTSNPTNPGATVFDNFGLVTSTFQFSSASYTVEEGGGSILITVTRAGSTTATGTVDYATADGTALQTTKYINAAGRLTFAPGEASKAFQVLIIDNALAEGNQNLNLLLQEPRASGLNTPGRAVLTIIDNDTTVPTINPLEDPTFFVTQHYYDFLNREADAPGLAFWVDQITGCGGDTQCIEIRRINVSAAYFLSIEFQETGFLVHRFYNLALNRPNGLPRYLEFFRDTQAIGNGVIVGADGWEALLEANRVSYANEFATRAEFTALYPLTLSAIEYVDALYAHAAITPSAAERQAAIDEFSTPAGARGRVLRRIAESQTLSAREFNRAFVLAQYFGYLRRNPDDAPDNNLDGYNFWLNKLNEFNGNFVNAEMVKAFITSGEYRHRFGT